MTSPSSTSTSVPQPPGTTLPPPPPQRLCPTPPPTTTTSLSSLPTECLQLILAYHRTDLTLLHALLLVNRTFFQLVVPLLYQSPFLLIKGFTGDPLPTEKFRRQVNLLWLLLSSVHHLGWVRQELPPFADEYPVLWNPALSEAEVESVLGIRRSGSDSTETTAPGGVRQGTKKTPVRFLTVDYLSFYTHHNHSSISDALPTLFPSLICYHMDQWSSSKDMIRIRATVERALLMHRPEGIVSLAVPITRVKAVQEAVAEASVPGSWSGLSRVRRIEFYDIRQEFSLEDVLSFLRSLRRPSSPGAGAGTRAEKMMLTEIKIGGPSDYGQIGKRDLYTILQEVAPFLKVIDLTDWRGAVMDLEQIPTDVVEVLHLRLDRMLGDDSPVEKVLERARRLRDLQICIGPGHGGLFRWAVEKRRRQTAAFNRRSRQGLEANGQQQQRQKEMEMEKEKEREKLKAEICAMDRKNSEEDDDEEDDDDDDDDEDQEESDESTGDDDATGGQLGLDWLDQDEESEEGLRVLSLAGETPSVVWGLVGATTAFCDQLQVLTASSWKQPHDGPLDATPDDHHVALNGHPGHGHGHGYENDPESDSDGGSGPAMPQLYWASMMTRLVHLELKGEIASVSFDMRSLAQCPVLQRLRLDTYKSEIEPGLAKIPEMLDAISATVTELELTGLWFVTDRDLDRMGRGGVLPRLRKLKLAHCKTQLEGGDRGSGGGSGGGGGGSGGLSPARSSMLTGSGSFPIIPDYLLAALPMQQDILPSVPSPVQSSKSVSSSSSRSPSSPSSSPSNALSSTYLSPKGLVRAVYQMTDLRELHIRILVTNRVSSGSSGSVPPPWAELEKVKEKRRMGEEDEEEDMLCLDEESLSKAFAAAAAATATATMTGQSSSSANRAFPLKVDIQKCRSF
ncbi:hypothetical protein BGX29_009241 [Mortierella sp. GBA35]|nr:hypothetical protein BGX29_009241 [Mortierella sp. GBA35]